MHCFKEFFLRVVTLLHINNGVLLVMPDCPVITIYLVIYFQCLGVVCPQFYTYWKCAYFKAILIVIREMQLI